MAVVMKNQEQILYAKMMVLKNAQDHFFGGNDPRTQNNFHHGFSFVCMFSLRTVITCPELTQDSSLFLYFFQITSKYFLINENNIYRMCDTDAPPAKLAKSSEIDSAIELIQFAKENNLDKVCSLLQDGADVTHQEEEFGASALMHAAGHGNVKMVKLLLEDGAVWNALDRKHLCAGDYAVNGTHQVKTNLRKCQGSSGGGILYHRLWSIA
jgi:hypothetical protein